MLIRVVLIGFALSLAGCPESKSADQKPVASAEPASAAPPADTAGADKAGADKAGADKKEGEEGGW